MITRFFKRLWRRVVRRFSWDAARFYVMGWHDSMYMDYQPPRKFDYHSQEKLYEFRLAHYEDGWNMEVYYNIRLDNNQRRARIIEDRNVKYNR
jgi:hypothetical protein